MRWGHLTPEVPILPLYRRASVAPDEAGFTWHPLHLGRKRPKFTGQRLSPRLNPTVGGDGSKPSHTMVFDSDDEAASLRQPKF